MPKLWRPRGEDVKFYVDDPKDYVPEDEARKLVKSLIGYVNFVEPITRKTRKFVCRAEHTEPKAKITFVQSEKEANREKEW